MNHFVDYSGKAAWGRPVPLYRREALRELLQKRASHLSEARQEHLSVLVVQSIESNNPDRYKSEILDAVKEPLHGELLLAALTDPEPQGDSTADSTADIREQFEEAYLVGRTWDPFKHLDYSHIVNQYLPLADNMLDLAGYINAVWEGYQLHARVKKD